MKVEDKQRPVTYAFRTKVLQGKSKNTKGPKTSPLLYMSGGINGEREEKGRKKTKVGDTKKNRELMRTEPKSRKGENQ